ncbi:MAG: DNA repair protein RecN [Paludibacteraceae bacterium]
MPSNHKNVYKDHCRVLKNLKIQNYALIEHLDIDFESGLSVITGETGAGKSIIIGALALVLGQRADTKAIQTGKNKCVVEAVFDVSDLALQPLFDELDIDYDSECILRREILDSGKSRAFVNDMPVNLQQLRAVANRLLDIHSQHENLLLGESAFQLQALDAVAESHAEVETYARQYRTYKEIGRQLATVQQTADAWRADRDYAQFQYDQLATADLTDDEQESLESELQTMNHAEEVKTAIAAALARLDGESVGVNESLRDSLSSLRRIEPFVPQMADYVQRIESALIDLKDVASDLEIKLNDTDFDPQRKEFVENRLDLIYTLEQKHHVASVAELLQLQSDLAEKLARIDGFDAEIEMLRKQLHEAEQHLTVAAERLSDKRRAAKTDFERIVTAQLTELGMPHANFVVAMTDTEQFLPSGRDNVEFLFSANKNAAPQPIAHTASGGELSRLMLVIKAQIANRTQLPTVVLDEIDTGVSGEVAHRMGLIMSNMSQAMQVLTITHLPQIAAKGAAHYKVYKHDTADATVTNIVRLTAEQRVQEVAEMLSGKNPSEAAISNARELLKLV